MPRLRDKCRLVRWFMTASLFSVATSICAQTAERPEWKVGDMWIYHEKGGLPVSESNWSRKLVGALPEGRFTVETEGGTQRTTDRQGNILDVPGPGYWRGFKFPLQVGNRWDFERMVEGTNFQGYVRGSWTVKAYETITVLAGTFECFKVEGMTWRNYTPTNRPGGITSANNRTWTTYWFCPAVKHAAKWHIVSMSPYLSDVTHTSELTSFTPAP